MFADSQEVRDERKRWSDFENAKFDKIADGNATKAERKAFVRSMKGRKPGTLTGIRDFVSWQCVAKSGKEAA
jgi:hypothetical protein